MSDEALCEKHSFTQQELADATGLIDSRRISRTKLGKWPRRPDAFVMIAIGFNRVLAKRGSKERVKIADLLQPLEAIICTDALSSARTPGRRTL